MITLERYNQIKSASKPVFIFFVVLFFIKEITFLIDALTFFQLIPDWLFLLVFLYYLIVDFLPLYGPQYIEGYTSEEEENEKEAPSNKEIKEKIDS